MTKEERRRAILSLGEWNLEKEDLSEPGRPLYRWTPRYVEPDPRLQKAGDNPAPLLKRVRCSEGDGRILGALLETSEGILWVAYVAQEGELRALATFLDELAEDVELRCRKHGRRQATADEIKTWAQTPNTEDLFI